MIAVNAWKCEWCGKITQYQYDPNHGDGCEHAPQKRTCISCAHSTEMVGSGNSKCAGIGYCKYIDELTVYPKIGCYQHKLTDGYEKYTE